MSLLVVGSVAFDSVRTIAGSVDNALGGSAAYFSIAASYFTGVQLVAVVGEDFLDQHRQAFDGRPINLDGLMTSPGKTFRWAGRYSDDFNQAFTLDTQLNVFETFRPQIPGSFRSTDYVFLANIDPDLQLDVLEQMDDPRFVACDTMNFWIHGKLDSLKKVISRVDMLVVNDQEVRDLTGERSVFVAARELMTWGPMAVVVKRGEFGAMVCLSDRFPGARNGDFIFIPAIPLAEVVDTTGAGDTFAGGLMGYIAGVNVINRDAIATGMACGATLASFNVQSFSVEQLSSLNRDMIIERYQRLRNAITIKPLDFSTMSG